MLVKQFLTQTVSLKVHPLHFFAHEIIIGLLRSPTYFNGGNYQWRLVDFTRSVLRATFTCDYT